jgi:hypothetical protein
MYYWKASVILVVVGIIAILITILFPAQYVASCFVTCGASTPTDPAWALADLMVTILSMVAFGAAACLPLISRRKNRKVAQSSKTAMT